MILLSVERYCVPQIAGIFHVSRATVRFWIKRFNAEGPAGLYDRPRSGRPRKVTAEVTHTLLELIQDDPLREGYLATFWTVAMLMLAVADRLKVTLSPSCLRRTLHQVGLRWGRPRLGMPNKVDPQKALKQLKQWIIVRAVVQAPANAAIVYGDECRIQLLPLVRAMWHWVGQQIRIPTPGNNVTRAVFGALNIRTGQWTYLVRDRVRKEDFIAFLEHLLMVYPSGPIILVADNYSSHTARLVKVWLAAHPRLQMYHLPTYCSHLNPVEDIWLRLKNELAANRLYGSMKLLLDTVDAFFSQMTTEKALAWTGT
jgi:transposase